MSDYITDWLIGISNTDADGVTMYRFRGTRKDVKELLLTALYSLKTGRFQVHNSIT